MSYKTYVPVFSLCGAIMTGCDLPPMYVASTELGGDGSTAPRGGGSAQHHGSAKGGALARDSASGGQSEAMGGVGADLSSVGFIPNQGGSSSREASFSGGSAGTSAELTVGGTGSSHNSETTDTAPLGGAGCGGHCASGGTSATFGAFGGSSPGAVGGAGGAITGSGGAPRGGGANSGGSATAGNVGTGCTGGLEEWKPALNLCVAKMAPILAPTGSQDYQIDVTEVTLGQYQAWVASQPSLPAATDTNCGWNTSYRLDATCNSVSACKSGCSQQPVTCVDWCDAYAYCAAVEKRLCGKIDGGPNSFSAYADANSSQWYRACSAGGSAAEPLYSFGKTFDETACNGYKGTRYADGKPFDVGTLPKCTSTVPGYTGVYDLSGNVWEWEDSCNGVGATSQCRQRGGSYYEVNDSGFETCGFYGISNARNVHSSSQGFRCCSK